MNARSSPRLRTRAALAILVAVSFVAALPVGGQQEPKFRFKTGVELVNVAVTVTDVYGRFVPNLTQDDFVVYEDNVAQPISYFTRERVPVSLGIALDTSGSMAGDKIVAAQDALNRFLYDLLGDQDEIFLYRFSSEPVLIQNWTRDRDRLRWQLGRITPKGETVLYDTVAEAVPLASQGQHRKKALVVISDGNDTGSRTTISELRQIIRESEVLVYAIGIDAPGGSARNSQAPQRPPGQIPWPFPQGKPPYPGAPPPPQGPGGWNPEERVNEAALRQMTDDSGGRTEVIRSARDLDPATARVADELSRQYTLAYPGAAQKDGRWHAIRVEVKNRSYIVRARRGYVAS
jgi:Ca-activated chloride channel homolog